MLTKVLTVIKKLLRRNRFNDFLRVFKSLSLRHKSDTPFGVSLLCLRGICIMQVRRRLVQPTGYYP